MFLTSYQIKLRKLLLSKIHAHREYRRINMVYSWADYLASNYGVESSKYLSISELENLIEILRGIKQPFKLIKNQRISVINYLEYRKAKTDATIEQINKAYALTYDKLKLNTTELKAFIIRQIGEYKKIHLLSKNQLNKLIVGLENWNSCKAAKHFKQEKITKKENKIIDAVDKLLEEFKA